MFEREQDGSLPSRILEQTSRAAGLFALRFGRSPTIAAFAPGRVNLIGEHTDYNQGFVLPIAIERQTVIVGDRAHREQSTIVVADFDEQMEVDLARPVTARRGKPGSVVLGVVDQFQMRGHVIPNMDLLIISDVPIGAGLSSSAAVEIAFATLVDRVLGLTMSSLEKARLCQAAEHEWSGVPCGIMDMFISAAAREHHALLIDCRNHHAQHVPFNPGESNVALVVIDTGVKRELARSEYAARRATCEEVATILGVPSLREATIESLNVVNFSDLQRRRALHVIAENTRAILAAEALAIGDFKRFGQLMFDSHASLRDLYEVSCPEVDALAETASSMRDRDEGVFGARMTGGGFGGCAIVLCEAAHIERVMDRLRDAFVQRFNHPPVSMFVTQAAGGARAMSWPC